MKSFIINTDGASRGNPGHAAAGFVIQTSDGVVWVEDGVYLGTKTNNEAEYLAVQSAFERLIKDFAKWLPADVEVRMDSNLLANQLSGNFKIKSPTLLELYKVVKNLESKIGGNFKYIYTPRSNNSLADKLANMALDKQLSNDQD